MSVEAGTSPPTPSTAPTGPTATRTYKPAMAAGWWLHNRNYLWYMVREFTALPMALWLLWLLYEIQRAGRGASHFYAPSSIPFVIFSVVCLLFSVYHSVTFLRLAGVILHFKVLDRPVPALLIVGSQFGAWLVASIASGQSSSGSDDENEVRVDGVLADRS